jgi:hypothetical protein
MVISQRVKRRRQHQLIPQRMIHLKSVLFGGEIKQMINGKYSKAAVSLAGALTTFLGIYYQTAKWYPVATGLIATVLVILVPNVSTAAKKVKVNRNAEPPNV